MIVVSMVFPLCQLVILGYAFGGQRQASQARDRRSGPRPARGRRFASWRRRCRRARARSTLIDYADQGQAVTDLRNGRRQRRPHDPAGVLAARPSKNQPKVALIEDNTDTVVVVGDGRQPQLDAHCLRRSAHGRARIPGKAALDVVEVYPYVPYIQYLLPGSIVMSIFMMVMVGGGIIFIDDKARGLHEGYLVTPITKLELIAGFNMSGTIKAVLAGLAIMLIGSIIAGRAEPVRSVAHHAPLRRDRGDRRSRSSA